MILFGFAGLLGLRKLAGFIGLLGLSKLLGLAGLLGLRKLAGFIGLLGLSKLLGLFGLFGFCRFDRLHLPLRALRSAGTPGTVSVAIDRREENTRLNRPMTRNNKRKIPATLTIIAPPRLAGCQPR